MRHRRIDWDRLAPLGLGGRLTVRRFGLGMIAAALFSWCVFCGRYFSLLRRLYSYRGGRRELISGAVMPPFYQTAGHAFMGFWFAALCMALLALWHYYYHYQDSRSIYLMRRLPDRWELWRRCLTLPLLGFAVCLLLAGVHLLIFFAIYQAATPPQCLQTGQWRMFLQNLFP